MKIYCITNASPDREFDDYMICHEFFAKAGGVGNAISSLLQILGPTAEWISIDSNPNKNCITQTSIETVHDQRDALSTSVNIASGIAKSSYSALNTLVWNANHNNIAQLRRTFFDENGEIKQDLIDATKSGLENNRNIAKEIAQYLIDNVENDDVILLEDYQMQLVGEEYRNLGGKARISYFHHTPFARQSTIDFVREHIDAELADLLIERNHALLHCDYIGGHANEFLENLRETSLPEIDAPLDLKEFEHRPVKVAGRDVIFSYNPISVPTDNIQRILENETLSPEIAARLDEEITAPNVIFGGGERLDPAKMRLEDLEAIEALLERDPSILEKKDIQWLFIFAPERKEVPGYEEYARQVIEKANDLNTQYGKNGFKPIVFFEGQLPNKDCVLITKYLSEELDKNVAAKINACQDGFNMTVLEMAMSGARRLLLSNGIGAAKFLKEFATLYDPSDKEQNIQVMQNFIKEMRDSEKAALNPVKSAVEKIKNYPLMSWLSRRCPFLSAEEADNLLVLNPKRYREATPADVRPAYALPAETGGSRHDYPPDLGREIAQMVLNAA